VGSCDDGHVRDDVVRRRAALLQAPGSKLIVSLGSAAIAAGSVLSLIGKKLRLTVGWSSGARAGVRTSVVLLVDNDRRRHRRSDLQGGVAAGCLHVQIAGG